MRWDCSTPRPWHVQFLPNVHLTPRQVMIVFNFGFDALLFENHHDDCHISLTDNMTRRHMHRHDSGILSIDDLLLSKLNFDFQDHTPMLLSIVLWSMSIPTVTEHLQKCQCTKHPAQHWTSLCPTERDGGGACPWHKKLATLTSYFPSISTEEPIYTLQDMHNCCLNIVVTSPLSQNHHRGEPSIVLRSTAHSMILTQSWRVGIRFCDDTFWPYIEI